MLAQKRSCFMLDNPERLCHPPPPVKGWLVQAANGQGPATILVKGFQGPRLARQSGKEHILLMFGTDAFR